MNYLLLLAALPAAASSMAVPEAPSEIQMASWAAFSKPVTLKMINVTSGEFQEWGESIWLYAYGTGVGTLSTYLVGLYQAGNLFGDKRARTEKEIAEKADYFAGLARKYPGRDSEDLADAVRVETRPDGRKVFFTIWGYNSEGASFLAFTQFGGYDLLLQQYVDFQTGKPEDQRLDDSPIPTKSLSDIFKQLEGHYVGHR